MPHPQPQPHPTPGADGYRVRSAPHALARVTVLAHPAQHPAPAAFRDLLARLHRLDAELALTAAPLCDDLYAARDGHPADFHRDVVLPLRRALHNGRDPRPAVLARLGDLPDRLPRLAAWLPPPPAPPPPPPPRPPPRSPRPPTATPSWPPSMPPRAPPSTPNAPRSPPSAATPPSPRPPP
ncbi:hypothetical protein ADK75_09010 [Streptomyces virginiae]|uniref:Uncharacterized protein n=1 Tax=Streptomyces virginiae TaxID=1961 RepID=A0A0L8N002_STRVG|nr:hypothetical protein [Streptomyces virginiae]KOG56002.1 hypothetical protein ADK75_09010 [Streptomyces virginiae]